MVTHSITGVGTFIYSISTGRYLFLMRNTHKYSGYWALPGGKIEAKEYLFQCLTRELQEEVAYDFNDAKVIPIDRYNSHNTTFVYHTFFIPVTEEFIPYLNQEHRGFCWVPLNDAPRPLHPGVVKTITSVIVKEKLKLLEKQLSMFEINNSIV